MSTQAETLIDTSAASGEITHAPYDVALASDLLALCDDYVHDIGRSLIELWGSADDGLEWRVHLSRAPIYWLDSIDNLADPAAQEQEQERR